MTYNTQQITIRSRSKEDTNAGSLVIFPRAAYYHHAVVMNTRAVTNRRRVADIYAGVC